MSQKDTEFWDFVCDVWTNGAQPIKPIKKVSTMPDLTQPSIYDQPTKQVQKEIIVNPNDLMKLVSTMMEMSRNHKIMATRLDNAEKEISILKAVIYKLKKE
ncbi:MAG: hypothetical protein WC390_11855 [Sulfurimonas sp.]|jgi:hypothetical protein